MNLANALGLLAAPLAAAPAAAQAVEPLLLMNPTTGWSVDYAEDSCVLRRSFGSGEGTALLELRQGGPGDSYELTLGSDTLASARRTPRVYHGTDTDWYEPARPSLLSSGNWHAVRFNDSLRPAALKPKDEAWPVWPNEDRDARETAVDQITIAGGFERDLTLRTGRMHAPMDALRVCTRELVTRWGLDPDVQDTLSRRVTPIQQAGWTRQMLNAYPLDMLRKGKSGRVAIRLLVDVNGKPTQCVATKGMAEPSFETAACSGAMRYARFEPALDAGGQPVASYWLTTILYSVP